MTETDYRNILAERIGKELTRKFCETCIAICGLGGLGSNTAITLARAGVGQLCLFDFDKVDISNLNRQQYKVKQIGMYKTEALKENLAEIAPFCNVTAINEKLTRENIGRLVSRCSIICECFDNPESKAMLVDAITEQYPPKYVIAASGMSGLHTGNTIHTRKLTDRLYICGDGESDVEKDGTLFAPRVMLCAAHQANTALRIIAGLNDG